MAGETYRTSTRIPGDAVAGAWTNWTPALTVVSGTDPVLGTDAGQVGRYVQLDKLVVAEFTIWFGASGVNAGSGTYRAKLPVAARLFNGGEGAGCGWAWDSSAAKLTTLYFRVDSSVGAVMYFKGTSNYQVANNQPQTWAAGDYLQGVLKYEAA